jgi:uncharacterized membrane protein
MRDSPATRVAGVAVVAFVTILLRFPIIEGQRADGTPLVGYLDFGDIAVLFFALRFGAVAGLVCGGVGSALADLIDGYTPFVLLTLVAKGCEGALAGWLREKRLLAYTLSGLAMICIYFAGECFWMAGWHVSAALIELPFNVIQWFVAVGVNAFVGWALSVAIVPPGASPIQAAGRAAAKWQTETILNRYSLLLVFLGLLASIALMKPHELFELVQKSTKDAYSIEKIGDESALVIHIDVVVETVVGIVLYVLFVFTLVLTQIALFRHMHPDPKTADSSPFRVAILATILFCMTYSTFFFAAWQHAFDEHMKKIQGKAYKQILLRTVGSVQQPPK